MTRLMTSRDIERLSAGSGHRGGKSSPAPAPSSAASPASSASTGNRSCAGFARCPAAPPPEFAVLPRLRVACRARGVRRMCAETYINNMIFADGNPAAQADGNRRSARPDEDRVGLPLVVLPASCSTEYWPRSNSAGPMPMSPPWRPPATDTEMRNGHSDAMALPHILPNPDCI